MLGQFDISWKMFGRRSMGAILCIALCFVNNERGKFMVRVSILLFIGLVVGGGSFAQEHVKLEGVDVRYSGIDNVDSTDPGKSLKTAFEDLDKDEILAKWWFQNEPDIILKRPKSGFVAETVAADQLDGEASEVAHDDGQQTGKSSMAGGGHAVKFESGPGAPAYLTSVRLYGSRYGRRNAPKEDFHVWLCDEEFKQIAEFDFPYSEFERGQPQWVTLKTKPTKVPAKFIFCVGFNPTGTKGVYMGYDQNGSGSSLSGLPGRKARAFPKGDWLIRFVSCDKSRIDRFRTG